MPRIWIHNWVWRVERLLAGSVAEPAAALSELPADGYVLVAAPRGWAGECLDRTVAGVSFGPPPLPPAPPAVCRWPSLR